MVIIAGISLKRNRHVNKNAHLMYKIIHQTSKKQHEKQRSNKKDYWREYHKNAVNTHNTRENVKRYATLCLKLVIKMYKIIQMMLTYLCTHAIFDI